MGIAATLAVLAARAAAKRLGKKLNADEVKDFEEAVVKEIAANPQVQNEVSAERPYQSRVAWGSVVAALGVIIPTASQLFGVAIAEKEVLQIGSAIVTLAGALFALYGRFKSGLKPLFSGR